MTRIIVTTLAAIARKPGTTKCDNSAIVCRLLHSICQTIDRTHNDSRPDRRAVELAALLCVLVTCIRTPWTYILLDLRLTRCVMLNRSRYVVEYPVSDSFTPRCEIHWVDRDRWMPHQHYSIQQHLFRSIG